MNNNAIKEPGNVNPGTLYVPVRTCQNSYTIIICGCPLRCELGNCIRKTNK